MSANNVEYLYRLGYDTAGIMKRTLLSKSTVWRLTKNLEKQDILQIYKLILREERGRFAPGTWEKTEHGYNNFDICFSYLLDDVLNIKTAEELINVIDHKLFSDYKLSTAFSELFDSSPYKVVKYSFPDANVKPWQMREAPTGTWNNETIIEATRWMFLEQLKLNDREQILDYATIDNFRLYGLGGALNAENATFNCSIFSIISNVFPEYGYKKWEFTHSRNWSEDEKREALIYFFEVILKWDKNKIRRDLTPNVFKEHHMERFVQYFFRGIKELLEFTYPNENWDNYRRQENNPKALINHEIANQIRERVELGNNRRNVAHEFGVSIHTVNAIVQGKIWTRCEF